MGETANKAAIADKAFKDIFRVFGWRRHGPSNEEWACVTKHKDAAPKTGKHPSDAVYGYVDPYLPTSVFVNIDFKSYKKTTLEKVDLAAALRSLGNTVDCANKSSEFADRYGGGQVGEVVGMLFVFNNDNQFDTTRFPEVLEGVSRDAMDLAKGRRMVITGPDQVAYLGTVANDIERLRGSDELRTFDRHFVLPNLIDHPARAQESLPIEVLLGPWQMVRFTGVSEGRPRSEIHLYYRSAGTLRQFEYLFDFLFRFQLLETTDAIYLRLPDAEQDASVQLEHAKAAFVTRYYGLKEVSAKLDRVTFMPVTKVLQVYSSIHIGMSND